MSDYGEYEEEGGDWIYVEDYWDEANELAEHTCPSPVPHSELAPEDYDVHDYWQDIEYISDGGYYEDHQPSAKRKIGTNDSDRPKKRRLRKSYADLPASANVAPVSWMTQHQRFQSQYHAPLVSAGKAKSIALLKDWNRRFKDSPGLATFPKSDVSMEEESEPAVSGDGFSLEDLQSIAGLLSEENMDTLQGILKEKGLDPDAVQEVLQDLIEGKERLFDEDDVSEEQHEEQIMDEEPEAEAEGHAATEARSTETSQTLFESANLMSSRSQTQRGNQTSEMSARGVKRRNDLKDGGSEDVHEAPVTRERKRRRGKNYDRESDDVSHSSSLRIADESPRAMRSTSNVLEDDVPRTRSGRARRR